MPATRPLTRILGLTLMILSLMPVKVQALDTADMTAEMLMENNKAVKFDLDGLAKRKIIRFLIPYNRSLFFFDQGQPKGASYEAAMLFQEFLNNKFKSKTVKIKPLVIPTPRDRIFTMLQEGYGDIAIGNLTITDERLQAVDFSDPFVKNVQEVLVTGKAVPEKKRNLDLAGMEIHVRKSSSYYEHLLLLNDLLKSTNQKPVNIVEADERLEDSDLLELVNTGVIPAIIIDEHKTQLWTQVFDNLKIHSKAAIATGGKVAWAIRKNSPQLKAAINEFAKTHKQGTLTGNVIINRYFKNAEYIKNSTQSEELKKFEAAVKMFRTYGDQYGFDYLMLAALSYQESRIDQSVRSAAGAVGVMQILPSTAKDKNVGISGIDKIEPNIHAGTKYLRWMADTYFPNEAGLDPLNRAFFTFASYNAGPNRVVQLRNEAKKMGLDPNQWFNHVEVVAAKRVGRETVQYVSNILKYYVAYKLVVDKMEKAKAEKG